MPGNFMQIVTTTTHPPPFPLLVTQENMGKLLGIISQTTVILNLTLAKWLKEHFKKLKVSLSSEMDI
jgi:CBS-domain-containing membrane protein